jgi:hypothetical protein
MLGYRWALWAIFKHFEHLRLSLPFASNRVFACSLERNKIAILQEGQNRFGGACFRWLTRRNCPSSSSLLDYAVLVCSARLSIVVSSVGQRQVHDKPECERFKAGFVFLWVQCWLTWATGLLILAPLNEKYVFFPIFRRALQVFCC